MSILVLTRVNEALMFHLILYSMAWKKTLKNAYLCSSYQELQELWREPMGFELLSHVLQALGLIPNSAHHTSNTVGPILKVPKHCHK